MQISLRSQMIAGATAVVGAGAIALTPIAPAAQLPALRVSDAAVTLAAFPFENPLTALLNTVGAAGNLLLNQDYETGAGAGAANWGATFVNTPVPGIGDALNGYLTADFLGGYSAVGLIPQILNDGLPIGTTVAGNLLGYVNTALAYGGAALGQISNVIWAIPATGLAIVNDIITGNFSQIVPDITAAVQYAVASISTAVTDVINGATAIIGTVAARATAVISTLGDLLPVLGAATAAQFGYLATSITDNITSIATALGTGNLANIWNATVDALVGPTGIPGALLNVTIGAGVQTGAIAGPETVAANFIPSVRTEIQTGVKAIAEALTATNPTPPPPPAAAKASRVAAPAAAVSASSVRTGGDDTSAPAAESAPAESSVAAGDNAAPKASKHGVSRKAAKAAAE